MKNLLIIGHTFPEPSTTAAGSRMMQLISLFSEEGYKVTFATTASISERSADLHSLGITSKKIELNNSSFDSFLLETKPSIVLFDRYITEEQFGWRVAEICPEATRILDTEDLHFLRKARETAIKKNLAATEADIFTDATKREIASILRSDLSLIISKFEMELLQASFSVSPEILYYLPFLVEKSSKNDQNTPDFNKRFNFLTIGNFLHKPNIDAVLWLKKEIWPHIKQELPDAVIHIYGAYAPQSILELHNKKDGFLIEGWAQNVDEVMQNARICLAPVRFGAGLKGKLLDAMANGTPSITTSIGAEGMFGELAIPGVILDDPKAFAKASVNLYTNEMEWLEAQQNGFRIVEERFQSELFSVPFIEKIKSLQQNLGEHRITNFIGQILQHQSMHGSKYMSKWIELKNKK